MSQKSKEKDRVKQLEKAKILSEALPYMRQFAGETFVIKYGGSAMGNPELAKTFARDVVMLKQVGINPIIVHGGGPQISSMLEKLKIQSSFIDGLRVTDQATVEIVEMVLSGSINKQIVSEINMAGGMAIGISGKDGGLISARKLRRTKSDPDSNIEQILDLGFVGEPTDINPETLVMFEESDIIPVIAPIGRGANGETYNINADSAAGAIASSIAATKLLMLTDVPGILDKNGELISEITISQAQKLIRNKTISGGMIPKVETCINALNNHTEAAHILDGRLPHVLLLEIFTELGTGSMILQG
ncbi:MAG: acetylglutamate kinase [Rickettsiales bacterium]|nr:acetylglutamate kinase [Pseudomonadota bacterium]MDA0965593.1 acetylglutamate kinase [Pseudomonadota bacterium]MDG4542917.1 acetylglutamate kinase [Rickettsiales bacterium]MDG4544635.1 acetylglutamate kinase [Rickettsiales bacterium]MDG4546757.1 acetylglutamate kinase [Rickettsiales bacterium]